MLWVVTKKGIDKINNKNKQIERYNQVYNENVLATPNAVNIQEIMLRNDNKAHFYTIFKKEFGVAPKEYRKV